MRVGGVAPVSVSFSLFRTVFRRFVVVTVLPFLLLFPFPLPQPLPGEVHYIHNSEQCIYVCVYIWSSYQGMKLFAQLCGARNGTP